MKALAVPTSLNLMSRQMGGSLESLSVAEDNKDGDVDNNRATICALLAKGGISRMNHMRFTHEFTSQSSGAGLHVAHMEWCRAFLHCTDKQGACISDAGADTWVLGGRVWHMEQCIAHKNACVIGHNQ